MTSNVEAAIARQHTLLTQMIFEAKQIIAVMQVQKAQDIAFAEKQRRSLDFRGTDSSPLLFDAMVGAYGRPGRLQRLERKHRARKCQSSR